MLTFPLARVCENRAYQISNVMKLSCSPCTSSTPAHVHVMLDPEEVSVLAQPLAQHKNTAGTLMHGHKVVGEQWFSSL